MRRICLILALVLVAAPAAAADPPRVVVTLKPVQSLAAAVMAGVGRPELLVRGTASPTSFSLRPAEVRMMNSATIVVFVSESLEGFVVRALENLPQDTRVVELVAADGLRLLPHRLGPHWVEDDGPRTSPRPLGTDPGAEDLDSDPYIWLDPQNARAIASALVDELSDVDPGRALTYARNLQALENRLVQLDQEIAKTMEGVKAAPFLVLHDAFQYFERRYGLSAAGAVTRRPDARPSPRRVSQVRARIAEAGAVCVFGEPQYPQAHAKMVSDGTPAKLGQLDALGASLPETAEAYPLLLRGVAEGFKACLGAR
ncbi:MAG: zinc ABC transporter substrate-binding protein [Alphaproteobacteria bacterium]|nr:zinc ABC transporter substrate-binding protein [Alphaproteobacteria bacterium]